MQEAKCGQDSMSNLPAEFFQERPNYYRCLFGGSVTCLTSESSHSPEFLNTAAVLYVNETLHEFRQLISIYGRECGVDVGFEVFDDVRTYESRHLQRGAALSPSMVVAIDITQQEVAWCERLYRQCSAKAPCSLAMFTRPLMECVYTIGSQSRSVAWPYTGRLP